VQGLCRYAVCGAQGAGLKTDAPYGSTQCNATPPTYDEETNPINSNTKCLYLHNLVKANNRDQCVGCGWPGRKCEKECIYALQWNPVGLPSHNVGSYRLRDDLRNVRPSLPQLHAF
jgi:hypothetical protein